MTTIARLFCAGLLGLAVAATSEAAEAGYAHKKKKNAGAAHSTAVANTNLHWGKVSFDSSSFATTSVELLAGGQYIDAKADAGNHTSFQGHGKTELDQSRKSKSKVYAKGGNVMAKARSEACVKIKAAGDVYVVSNEVARAMTRFTPLGTTATASSQSNLTIVSNGYVGMTSSTSEKAHVRIKVQ